MKITPSRAPHAIFRLGLALTIGACLVAAQGRSSADRTHSKTISTSFPKTKAPVNPALPISIEILGPGKKGVICVYPSAEAADHVQIQAILAYFSPNPAMVDGLRLEKMIPLDPQNIQITANSIHIHSAAADHQRALIYVLVPPTADYSVQLDGKIIAQPTAGSPIMISAGTILDSPAGYNMRTALFEMLGFRLHSSDQ